jgi:internalin A
LIDTQITDASLPRLKSLPRLEYLHLNGTKVTDAGMECLGGFTQLRVLRFENTGVTDAGVMELQQFLPNTQIVR